MEYAEQHRRLIKGSVLANGVLLLGAIGITLPLFFLAGKASLAHFIFVLFTFAGLIAVQIIVQPILWGWVLQVEPGTRLHFIFSGLVLGVFAATLYNVVVYLLTGDSLFVLPPFFFEELLPILLTLVAAGSLFVYTKPRQLPWFAVIITQVSNAITLLLFPLLSTAIGYLMSLL